MNAHDFLTLFKVDYDRFINHPICSTQSFPIPERIKKANSNITAKQWYTTVAYAVFVACDTATHFRASALMNEVGNDFNKWAEKIGSIRADKFQEAIFFEINTRANSNQYPEFSKLITLVPNGLQIYGDSRDYNTFSDYLNPQTIAMIKNLEWDRIDTVGSAFLPDTWKAITVDQFEEIKEALNSTTNIQDQKIETIGERIIAHDNRFNRVESTLDFNYKNQLANFNNLTQKANELQNTSTEQTDKINQLKEKLEALNNSTNGYQEQINSANQKIEEAKQEASWQVGEIRSLAEVNTTELNSVKEKVDNLSEKIENLEVDFNAHKEASEAELHNIEALANANKNDIDTLKINVTNLGNQTPAIPENLNEQINQLREQIQNLSNSSNNQNISINIPKNLVENQDIFTGNYLEGYPIYARLFKGRIPNSRTVVLLRNVRNLIDYFGTIKRNRIEQYHIIQTMEKTDASHISPVFQDGSNVSYYSKNSNYSNQNYILVIYFTKNTDTPIENLPQINTADLNALGGLNSKIEQINQEITNLKQNSTSGNSEIATQVEQNTNNISQLIQGGMNLANEIDKLKQARTISNHSVLNIVNEQGEVEHTPKVYTIRVKWTNDRYNENLAEFNSDVALSGFYPNNYRELVSCSMLVKDTSNQWRQFTFPTSESNNDPNYPFHIAESPVGWAIVSKSPQKNLKEVVVYMNYIAEDLNS
ncbi:hypothetical protein [Mycoplasmopsis sturni]|uniref:hypothetical protein n=1 Tax=Mycoplasmopsis sturni TaxID=39047 RepID=UPI0005665EAF|nr:hypothetical protein [Mycoplasmopsis sturni]